VQAPARLPVRGSGSPDATVPEVASVDSVVDDGSVTVVTTGPVTIGLARVVGTPLAGSSTLTGTILEDPTVLTLATLL
jgi:hypothetical protein